MADRFTQRLRLGRSRTRNTLSLIVRAMQYEDLSQDDLVTMLRLLKLAAEEMDTVERDVIRRARGGNMSWADIASALGLKSRQAAEQRYLRLEAAITTVSGNVLDRNPQLVRTTRNVRAVQRSLLENSEEELRKLAWATFEHHDNHPKVWQTSEGLALSARLATLRQDRTLQDTEALFVGLTGLFGRLAPQRLHDLPKNIIDGADWLARFSKTYFGIEQVIGSSIGARAGIDIEEWARRDQEKAPAERVVQGSWEDSVPQRIVTTFGKTVEQLGSEKATVRLHAIFELERLAQESQSLRQAVVNEFCTYLRRPYMVPLGPSPWVTLVEQEEYREPIQEDEIRGAIQNILVSHLRPEHDSVSSPIFWADIDLYLAEAVLTNFDLTGCLVRTVDFTSAMFAGPAKFGFATFAGAADFRSAKFTDLVDFESARFSDSVDFKLAEFAKLANFKMARFADIAMFGSVEFIGTAEFESAAFSGTAYFESAHFIGDADFTAVAFADVSYFKSAAFNRSAKFVAATFANSVPPELERFGM